MLVGSYLSLSNVIYPCHLSFNVLLSHSLLAFVIPSYSLVISFQNKRSISYFFHLPIVTFVVSHVCHGSFLHAQSVTFQHYLIIIDPTNTPTSPSSTASFNSYDCPSIPLVACHLQSFLCPLSSLASLLRKVDCLPIHLPS